MVGSEIPNATIASSEDDTLAEPSSSTQSVGTIKGIRLVGNPSQVNVDNPPATSGVVVADEELVVPEGVTEAIEEFIGGPLSLRSIEEISRAGVLAYRAAGLPVVDLGFPEQNVSGGVLQLVVIVGRAGEIRVEGNRYFKDDIYLRSFSTQTGDVLWEVPIIDDLNYLNNSPYRRVDMVYTPGTNFGEADLILQADERRPWSVYTGYENTGSEFLGEDRVFFGGEWGNVGGWDHTLSYQYTTSTDFDSLNAHSAIYRIPIWQLRHELRFLAAYVEADGILPTAGGGPAFNSGGRSSQLSAAYLFQGPQFLGYSQEFEVGFDHKSSNNNLEFGGAQVFNNTAEIFQFTIGQKLRKQQEFGHHILGQRLVWSPGDWSNHNSDAVFNGVRANASSDYVYWHGEFTQVVNLPKGFTFLFDVDAQLSNANLLPSESFILGGVGSVRGFEQNLNRADEGVRVSFELYAPEFSLWQQIWGGGLQQGGESGAVAASDEEGADPAGPMWQSWRDSARLFAFYDQSWANNEILLPGEARNIQMGGAGLGLDYRLADRMAARLSYGWQVNEHGIADDGENGRWHAYVRTTW